GVTLTSGLPWGSWRRTYRATVTKTITIDSKKCVATEAGCRSVHTVIPPTTPWPSTPPGMIAAISVRSRLRGTERRTARSVMTPTTNTRKVSVRLPNSTAALKAVCPVLVGTKLSGVHLGHSEQPNPEEVTRTTAPVTAIPALTTTLPNAQARRDRGDGVQMVRARRSRTITPAAARANCQPQKGTPRTTTSSRSAATGGRVLGAAAAAGATDIRQSVVHGPGLHDATPPLSSPARTCSPHTRIGTSGKAVVRGSTSTVVASSSPCNAADRPGAAGRLCELHLRRRRFVSLTGPALRGCSSPSLR